MDWRKNRLIKFTQSVDGVKRATIQIETRISKTDLVNWAAGLLADQVDRSAFDATNLNILKSKATAINTFKQDILFDGSGRLAYWGDHVADVVAVGDLAKAKIEELFPELKNED